MIYSPLTKLAMKIAYEAHLGQVDKNGIPYIYHPVHLAEQMNEEIAICVALLHDVAEDTDITVDELAARGFPKSITDPLRLLTHEDGVDYMDYIKKIAKNETATRVKLADLKHNSDLTRLDTVDEKAERRAEKYLAAINILTGAVQ